MTELQRNDQHAMATKPISASPAEAVGILAEIPCLSDMTCCQPSSQASTASDWVSFSGDSMAGSIPSAVGSVPRLTHRLTARDRWGALRVRLGLGRNRYAVRPGLYGMGRPTRQSPVLVTANYKLSVDTLRRELAGLDVWILVLDTAGINVWCAAGKGTFGHPELIHRLKESRLEQIVDHRRLILPQLGASGVAGHEIRKHTGFRVIWGPIRARDIATFLKNPQRIEPSMRRVSFTLSERIILVPVEIRIALKPAAWGIGIGLSLGLLLGLAGPGTLAAALEHMVLGVAAVGIGIFSGAVMTPILLPWLPGKIFALKGATMGLLIAILGLIGVFGNLSTGLAAAFVLMVMATSSFLAMNFTGATPFTSPSGVEKEMRRAIPFQAMVMFIGTAGWLAAVWSG